MKLLVHSSVAIKLNQVMYKLFLFGRHFEVNYDERKIATQVKVAD